MNRVLIAGCGDIGGRVADALLARGDQVRALVRSDRRAGALAARGVEVVRADLDAPDPDLRIAGADTVICLVPPPAAGTHDPRVEALLHLLEPAPPARFVYISTSGVYGDCGGAWVDEDRPPAPRTARARRRYAAERALGRWCGRRGVAAVILRVPGIYGPGRLPVERIRRGLPLLRPEDSPFSNRIHAVDLAAACLAAIERGRPGRVYNAADGHPSTLTDYFFRVADLLGMPRPPVVPRAEADRAIGAAMRSYLEESRRLDNRRLREELGVELRYPDLEAGLPACIAVP